MSFQSAMRSEQLQAIHESLYLMDVKALATGLCLCCKKPAAGGIVRFWGSGGGTVGHRWWIDRLIWLLLIGARTMLLGKARILLASRSVLKPRFNAAAALSTVIPFKLADIGEGIAEVELLKWFVKVLVRKFPNCSNILHLPCRRVIM